MSTTKKVTGFEVEQNIPKKVLLLYQAIIELISEGADINSVKVSEIAQKAGVGKGTAYDYFETKEEMIACALIYMMTGITSKINEGLITKRTFEEKIQYLLDQTENKIVERECFFRFVHLMTDSSICAQHLKQKTEENNQINILPVNMIRQLLEEAMESGEIRNDFPIEYMVCTISAKIISYVVCICTQEMMSIRPDELKPLILNSIIKEFK